MLVKFLRPRNIFYAQINLPGGWFCWSFALSRSSRARIAFSHIATDLFSRSRYIGNLRALIPPASRDPLSRSMPDLFHRLNWRWPLLGRQRGRHVDICTCKHTRGALIEASTISVILRNETYRLSLLWYFSWLETVARLLNKIPLVSFHHSIIKIW